MSVSPKHRGRFVLCLVSICVLIIASHSVTAAGSTITVNSTLDEENNSDGWCTLREAITAAFRRREVYATSGTRILLRVFAGYDFSDDDARASDIAALGFEYAGV